MSHTFITTPAKNAQVNDFNKNNWKIESIEPQVLNYLAFRQSTLHLLEEQMYDKYGHLTLTTKASYWNSGY